TSGAGQTPRRWRGPRAPWPSCARPSPSWSKRWPMRATGATPGPSAPPRKPSPPAEPGSKKPSTPWLNSAAYYPRGDDPPQTPPADYPRGDDPPQTPPADYPRGD